MQQCQLTGGHEGLLVTLEAAIVSTLHTARPPASMRGRSVRSARKPAGTRATAYSTCSGRACPQHPIWAPGLMAASISSIPVQRKGNTAMASQHVSQGTMVAAKAEGAHRVADSQQGALVVAQIQVWCDQWQKRRKGKSAEEQSHTIQQPLNWQTKLCLGMQQWTHSMKELCSRHIQDMRVANPAGVARIALIDNEPLE